MTGFGDSMQVQGMAAGRDRARAYRRQNEQDEMAAKTHEMEMETRGLQNENLGLRVEGNKFANERAGVQAGRQDKQYEYDQKIEMASRALKAGLFNFATTGDLSGVVTALNTQAPWVAEIEGYERIEPKSETEPPKFRIKFKSGNEWTLTENEIGGLVKEVSEPGRLFEAKEAKRQEIAAKQEALEAEERGLQNERDMTEFKLDAQVDATVDQAEQLNKIGLNASGQPIGSQGGMETKDSNYFKSYFGAIYGGKFENGAFRFGEGKEEQAAEAMAIAERAYRSGYGRAEAAALGYFATDGEISEEKARETALKEYQAAREEGLEVGKKRPFIESRAQELVEESKWAKIEVQRRGFDPFADLRERQQGTPQQGQQQKPDQGLMIDANDPLAQFIDVEP